MLAPRDVDLSAVLDECFDYDLWANRQWVAALGGFSNMLRAQQILEHILYTQKVWLKHCGVEVLTAVENVPMAQLFADMSEAWQMILGDQPIELPIIYTNSAGRSHQHSIEQIARHVILHGAYHRGQLRGLAESEGFSGYPGTDLIQFFQEGSV